MKIFKFFLKLILIVIIIVAIALGIVVYQLSDNSFSEPDYLKNVEPIEIDGNKLISKGIKNSNENNKISLTFEEKEMNILLKTMSLDINKQLENSGIKIETMYLDVKNSHDIEFISYFDIKGFKTSLRGDFVLDIKDEIFTMTIEDFKVGKMKFEKDTVSSLLNRFSNPDNLKTSLELAGITLNADLSSFVISFDIMDLKNLVSNTGNREDLYFTLIDIFFRVENLITLSELNDNIGIDIDLSTFNYNEEVDVKMPYEIDFDSVNTKVETLLNSGVVEVSDASNAATYIAKGYINSPESIKEYVVNKDFSSIGINNIEEYQGIVPVGSDSLEDMFINQLPSLESPLASDISSFEGLKLTEEGWNAYFATSDAVGQVHSFVRDEDGTLKSSYIAIESLYVDIKDDHFALFLVTSINGKRIIIDFELDSESNSGLRISSDVSAMRIGSDVLLDNEIKNLLRFLNSSIRDKWIIIDSENRKMDFDFSLLFEGSQELTDFMEYLTNTKTSFVEEDGEGYTLISADLDLGLGI